jgi:erythromycin esterase-like protein
MHARVGIIWLVTIGLWAGLRAAPPAQQPLRPTIPDVQELGPKVGAIAKEVVRQLCGRQIVLLGESPTHGFGKTMRFKAELVRELVDGCQFDTVFFESGIYDFLYIQTKIKHGEVGRTLRRPGGVSGRAAAGGLEVSPIV